MGVIQRFKDIMSANINALLDKAEDPEKMIDQYMRNLESDLGKVKAETASIMAEETRSKRELEECQAEADKMQRYAEKAVTAGNDTDARAFLQQKKILTDKYTALKQAYDLASANAVKMRQMHDKLVNDMTSLSARRDSIKAKVAVAKAQQRVNEIGASVSGASNNLSAFDKMEEKANKMLDTANAMSELNADSSNDSIDDLEAKYESVAHADVDDELAALKAKLGAQPQE